MKLPVSALKIDRSFVSMIDSEGRHDDIVGAIITLARNLGLKVIAEGVETKSQYEALKRLKCEAAQGYHFAPPMTFGALKEFLNYVDYDVDLPPAGFDDVSTLLQIQ
jgi:EAL domain-containing protein (putative c-di-GMP-specific phosphodiesterase class I)